jgi:hypothetical protein
MERDIRPDTQRANPVEAFVAASRLLRARTMKRTTEGVLLLQAEAETDKVRHR